MEISESVVKDFLNDAFELSEVPHIITADGPQIMCYIEGPAGQLAVNYNPTRVAAELLNYYASVNERLDLPDGLPENWRDEDAKAHALMAVAYLLANLEPAITLILRGLLDIAKAQVMRHDHELTAADSMIQQTSVPPGRSTDKLEEVLGHINNELHALTLAPGRGRPRRVTVESVRMAARDLGDNANQKAVAYRLNVSEHALTDWAKSLGFEDWRMAFEAVMNLK